MLLCVGVLGLVWVVSCLFCDWCLWALLVACFNGFLLVCLVAAFISDFAVGDLFCDVALLV